MTDYVGGQTIPTGQEKILFVDDEEALIEMGEDLLAELGYEVVCRTGSREALALFRLDPSRFDVVITDQTMPDMTGLELARAIMNIRPETPVIMTTGFSHLVDADSAKAAGIKGFVMKPRQRGNWRRPSGACSTARANDTFLPLSAFQDAILIKGQKTCRRGLRIGRRPLQFL